MEKLRLSEEKVIKLGKKLVEELDFEESNNTLGRWMAHYIAELIHKINKTKSEVEKLTLQKECSDVILKLWKQRDSLPVYQPLTDLAPLIKILNSLKSKSSEMPIFWFDDLTLSKPSNLDEFVKQIKRSSESIFYKILKIELSQIDLTKNKSWIEEYKEFFGGKKRQLVEFVDELVEVKGNDSCTEPKDINMYFSEIEELLCLQQSQLIELKKNYFKSAKV